MLYAIGYGQLTPPVLRRVMDKAKVTHLVDVRSIPQSRRKGFSRRALESEFPEYMWKGDCLGGIKPGCPGTTQAGLDWLVEFQVKNTPLLLCVCHTRGFCHTHQLIAVPLLKRGIDCKHIYENEVILASSLAWSMEDDARAYDSVPLFK